jgi:hypothetical protein
MIPIDPPANPHQIKLLVPQSHTASVPKINAPNAQPRAMQKIRIPIIWLVLIADRLSLYSLTELLKR